MRLDNVLLGVTIILVLSAVVIVSIGWLWLKGKTRLHIAPVSAALVEQLRSRNSALEQRLAQQTADLSWADGALRTVSACSLELAQANSEADLLARVCRLLVDTGGYRLAWVGFTDATSEGPLRPAAHAGLDAASTDETTLPWNERDIENSQIGAAIRTCRPVVTRLLGRPPGEPWQAAVLALGCASQVSLPLLDGEHTYGVLEIYSARPEAFDPQEVGMLAGLAACLGYGVLALRSQAARQDVEKSLERSQAILLKTSRLARVGGWDLDLATMIPHWTEGTYRIHEVDPSVQPNLADAINFYAPESRPAISAAIERAITEGTGWDLELQFITATGRRLWVRAQGEAEFDDGRCIRLSGAFQDITERKQAELALRANEKRLAGIIASAMDAIITVDSDQRILLFNEAAEKMFGREAAQVLGQPLDQLIPARFRESHARHIIAFGQTGLNNRKMNAVSGLRFNGEEFPIESCISQLDEGGRRLFTVIVRDVSERTRMEEQLRRSERHYHHLFENMHETLVVQELVTDEAGEPVDLRFLDVNPAAERILGRPRAEIVGRTRTEVSGRADPEGLALASRVAASGEPNHMVRYSAGFGGWFESSTYLLESRVVASLALDITERMRAEEQLQSTLARLEVNNRELQDFAYVASHDLQEPLRKIQAFGDRLAKQAGAGLDEKGRDYLERMRNAAERMQQLINDLLTFSRVTTKAQPFAPVDLGQVARGVISDLEVRIDRSGGLVEVDALPTIEADATQMRQVLQNLIVNALKFHKPGIPPQVRVTGALLDGYCELRVADNGIGFDEKYLDRIFTPFQRLHGRGEYEGTGIGLAVVRKIVERHGGRVTARSRPDAGAEFVVTLPVRRLQED